MWSARLASSPSERTQALAQANQGADLMECEALLARITLLDHDPASAADYARSARELAAKQRRAGWVLQARLLELLALEDAGGGRPGPSRAGLVAALDDARWADAAIEARLAARAWPRRRTARRRR